MKHDTKLMTFR